MDLTGTWYTTHGEVQIKQEGSSLIFSGQEIGSGELNGNTIDPSPIAGVTGTVVQGTGDELLILWTNYEWWSHIDANIPPNQKPWAGNLADLVGDWTSNYGDITIDAPAEGLHLDKIGNYTLRLTHNGQLYGGIDLANRADSGPQLKGVLQGNKWLDPDGAGDLHAFYGDVSRDGKIIKWAGGAENPITMRKK